MLFLDHPGLGRFISYALTDADVAHINSRRKDGAERQADLRRQGFQAHVGVPVKVGDVFPMLITVVHHEQHAMPRSPKAKIADPPPMSDPVATGKVGGQVFLAGNDTLWVAEYEPKDPEAAQA